MPTLGFDVVDDLALVWERRHINPSIHFSELEVKRLGPVVEFEFLGKTWSGQVPTSEWLAQSKLGQVMHRAMGQESPVIERMPGSVLGFLRLAANQVDDDFSYVQFGYAAQEAAKLAGITPKASQALVGAIGELKDNVYFHSHCPETGLLGFLGANGDFEFSVADSGIGVLESLREHTDYRGLSNSGEAINVALTDGESRYGRSTGHGQGFRDLFRGLTKLEGELRFRSDDYCLSIGGTSPTLNRAKLRQSARVRGFLASVTCRGSGRNLLSGAY